MHALVFNKTKIRLVSLFLCFSLCISMTLGMVVQEPAHAELVLTATTAMVAVTIAMFTVMGITFVKTGDAEKAAKAFVQSSQEVHDMVEQISDNMKSGSPFNNGNGDGSNKIKLTAACNAALAVLFHKAKEFFHIGSVNKGTVSVPDSSRFSYQGYVVYASDLKTVPAPDLYTLATYGRDDVVTFSLNGVDYRYYYYAESGSLHWGCLCGSHLESFLSASSSHLGPPRYGFYYIEKDGNRYIEPFLVIIQLDSSGNPHFYSYFPEVYNSNGNYPYITYPVDSVLTPMEVPVTYQNGSKYSVTDIYDLLKDKLTLAPAPIEIDYSDILKQIEENQEEQIKKTQEEILIEIGIKDALDDKNADGNKTPDNPAPSAGMPDIGGIWDYVKNFLSKALIWMQLWYSGFVLLPPELQITLWALLVITIILGVLGVILR